MAEAAGFRVQAFDKCYGEKRATRKGKRSSMDLNSNAGMVLLVEQLKVLLCNHWPIRLGGFAKPRNLHLQETLC